VKNELGVGLLGTSRRVLIVEDDLAVRESASELLEDEGFEVSTSDQGLAALLALRDGRPLPDLIVLDLRMPVMDGWTFRDKQRTDPLLADIPVLAISADSSPRARSIPADAYLAKPFSADTLLRRIDQVLREREQRWIYERLGHAQRLAVLGTMTAGIGHEINNALSVVSTNLDIAHGRMQQMQHDLAIIRQAPLPLAARGAVHSLSHNLDTLLETSDDARAGAQRIQDIASGLRAAARLPGRPTDAVDLSSVISGALRLASSKVESRARVALHAEPVPLVEGDAGQLTQVVLNLLVNAAQALDPAEVTRNYIRVRLHRQPVEDRRAPQLVSIEVSDNGPGIPAPLQKRIFEPFFTTKPTGVGTGLGLFISRSIMKAHGGDLTVSSELGRGATFRLELPLAAAGGLQAAH
jgi:signal transduction histidine kinase